MKSKKTRILALIAMLLSSPVLFSESSISQEELELEEDVYLAEDEFVAKLQDKVVKRIQKEPRSIFAFYLLSYLSMRLYQIHLENESFEESKEYAREALEHAQHAIALDSNGKFGLLALAHVSYHMGFDEQAWNILRKIEGWRARYSILKYNLESVTPWNSIQELKNLLKIYPESFAIVVPLLLKKLEPIEKQAKSKFLLNFSKEYSHPLVFSDLAKLSISNSQFDHAEEYYSQMMCLDNSDHLRVEVDYAGFLAESLKDSTASRKQYLELLKNHDLSKDLLSQVHTNLSLLYIDQGDFKKFSEHSIEAMKASSNNALTLKTILETLSDKYPDAFDAYVEKINLRFPGNAKLYAIIAEIYRQRLKNSESAMLYYEKASVLDPENEIYRNILSELELEKENSQ